MGASGRWKYRNIQNYRDIGITESSANGRTWEVVDQSGMDNGKSYIRRYAIMEKYVITLVISLKMPGS